VKAFIENVRTYGTTEDTEENSVSSKKRIKRQSIGRKKIDSSVEDGVIFENNFSAFSVVRF